FRSWKILDGSRFLPELVQLFDGQPLRVVDRGVPFSYARDFSSIFPRQEFRSLITDVPEALDDDCFSFKSRRQANPFQIFGVLKSRTDAVLDAPACCFTPAVDATLLDGFACHASEMVNASRKERVVGVRHPCHLTFARSDIGSGNVLSRTNVFLANQLSRKTPGNLFELLF